MALKFSPSTVGRGWLSLVSNATVADGATIRRIVPHWLRVFGPWLREILIILDTEPLEGRIAELQYGQSRPEELQEAIRVLEAADPRVRFAALQTLSCAATQRRWFGNAHPVRCHAGTPILAFAAAIDNAESNVVLRCDSDMLFCEKGWVLDEAIPCLQEGVDVYEPPRLQSGTSETPMSSRAFMVAKEALYGHLPLCNLRLDPLRVLLRTATGRPRWVALEQMISRAAAKGQLSHKIGWNTDLGFSLHGLKRSWIASPWFEDVVRSIELGQVPDAQRKCWDFHPEFWGH